MQAKSNGEDQSTSSLYYSISPLGHDSRASKGHHINCEPLSSLRRLVTPRRQYMVPTYYRKPCLPHVSISGLRFIPNEDSLLHKEQAQ